MKIYKDKNRLQEVTSISFGEVEAGQTQDIILYLYNETKALLRNLNIKVSHSDVKIVSAPTQILPESIETLRLRWLPSLIIKKKLECSINIVGEEIYK